MKIFKPHETVSFLSAYLPEDPMIIEAGAYTGNDSVKLAQAFPAGTIHCFEPVPEIFQKLVKNTKNYPNISQCSYALSNQNGQAPLYIAEKPHNPGKPMQAGSLQKPYKRLEFSPIIYPKIIIVPTITLDTWAEKYNISHIDLLWLDLQGHEFKALQGAQTILQKTDLIFLEVHFVQAYYDHPLYPEISTWLAQHGFKTIGKDFETIENKLFGNVVFLKK